MANISPRVPQPDENFIPTIETIVSIYTGLVTIDTQSGVMRLVHYKRKNSLSNLKAISSRKQRRRL